MKSKIVDTIIILCVGIAATSTLMALLDFSFAYLFVNCMAFTVGAIAILFSRVIVRRKINNLLTEEFQDLIEECELQPGDSIEISLNCLVDGWRINEENIKFKVGDIDKRLK